MEWHCNPEMKKKSVTVYLREETLLRIPEPRLNGTNHSNEKSCNMTKQNPKLRTVKEISIFHLPPFNL